MFFLRTLARCLAWVLAGLAAALVMLAVMSRWGLWFASATGSGMEIHRGGLTVRICPTGALTGIPPGWRLGHPEKMGISFALAGSVVTRERPRWLYDVRTVYISPPPAGGTGEIGRFVKVSLWRSALAAGCCGGGVLLAIRLRWGRVRPGHCLECGYNRRGLAKGAVCPECGSARGAKGG